MTGSGPPRLAERILASVLPTPMATHGVLGDLAEEFVLRANKGSRARATIWYWGQTFAIVWRYLWARRRGGLVRPSEARRNASRSGAHRIEHLVHDIEHGVRLWRKTPVLAVTTVLTLALGIAAPATMFSIVHGVLRTLPFDRGEDIAYVARRDLARGVQGLWVPAHDYRDWRARQTTFEDLGAYRSDQWSLSDDRARPERIGVARVTPNTFSLLRVGPAMGRGFSDGETAPGAAPVAVIAWSLWRDRFGADTTVLGTTIRLNRSPYTIVGVMPEGFAFPRRTRAWTPLRAEASGARRAAGDFEVFGRLAEGHTLESARAEFDALTSALAAEYPDTNADYRAWILEYTDWRMGRELRPILYTMFAVMSSVLLIACANVANLLTTQAVARSRELAVRAALGASRGRLAREFLAQVALTAGVGGVLGVALTEFAIRLFNRGTAGAITAFWVDVRVDGMVLAFAVGATVLACVLAGVLPAVQASRTGVSDALKDEGRGASSFRLGRLSGGLIVAEIAFSTMLLVIAGLMIKGIVRLEARDFGFPADRLLVGAIEPDDTEYDTAERRRFFSVLRDRIVALPGVAGATLSSTLPGLNDGTWPLTVGNEQPQTEDAYRHTRRVVVEPNFFATLGASVIAGTGFGPEHGPGAPRVAVVNQRFAERFFSDADPIGGQIRFGYADWDFEPRTIIGVVPDLFMGSVTSEEANADGVYVPMSQASFRSMYVLVSTIGDPRASAPAVRAALAALDDDLPLHGVSALDEAIRVDNAVVRVFGTLFLVIGTGALFMACVGLYGMVAFSVSRRTREFGVRVALGAGSGHVASIVMRRVLLQLIAGVFLGLVLAGAAAPALREGFLGVDPRDGQILGAVVALLSISAVLAAVRPVRRAAAIDPMEALRAE